MGTTDKVRCHTEGRTWEEIEGEESWEDTERQTHIYRKRIRKKPENRPTHHSCSELPYWNCHQHCVKETYVTETTHGSWVIASSEERPSTSTLWWSIRAASISSLCLDRALSPPPYPWFWISTIHVTLHIQPGHTFMQLILILKMDTACSFKTWYLLTRLHDVTTQKDTHHCEKLKIRYGIKFDTSSCKWFTGCNQNHKTFHMVITLIYLYHTWT
jgi:hypothetical protein